MLKWLSVAAVVCTWVYGIAQPTKAPQLGELLKRVGAYVHTYGEHTSALVATERYTQAVSGNQAGVSRGRTTVADFAIVRPSGSKAWFGFRDIVEVDGKPVVDHRDRLLSLLTAPGDADEAVRLTQESTRFNIGPVVRDFNVPTTALFFFVPENLDRFTFKMERANPDGESELAFREIQTPTLIESHGRPVPVEGKLFVGANGEVHRTIMTAHAVGDVRGVTMRIDCTVDVEYKRLDEVGMSVPSLMTEEYSYVSVQGAVSARIHTRAEYSNYRRFETSVRIK